MCPLLYNAIRIDSNGVWRPYFNDNGIEGPSFEFGYSRELIDVGRHMFCPFALMGEIVFVATYSDWVVGRVLRVEWVGGAPVIVLELGSSSMPRCLRYGDPALQTPVNVYINLLSAVIKTDKDTNDRIMGKIKPLDEDDVLLDFSMPPPRKGIDVGTSSHETPQPEIGTQSVWVEGAMRVLHGLGFVLRCVLALVWLACGITVFSCYGGVVILALYGLYMVFPLRFGFLLGAVSMFFLLKYLGWHRN